MTIPAPRKLTFGRIALYSMASAGLNILAITIDTGLRSRSAGDNRAFSKMKSSWSVDPIPLTTHPAGELAIPKKGAGGGENNNYFENALPVMSSLVDSFF